jgi:hypothetical protein
MLTEEYKLGQLIWGDFEFPTDEKGKEHPAIVLEDQGDSLAVLSGTSLPIEKEHIIRNESFCCYILNPNEMPYRENGLTQKTYFEFNDNPKPLSKENITRKSEVIDSSSLEELMKQTYLRAWFFENSFCADRYYKGDVICWREDDATFSSIKEIKFAIILARMKNGKLKVIPELESDAKTNNYLYFTENVPVVDVKNLRFQSKPDFLKKEQIILIAEKLKPEQLKLVEDLPYIKANSKKNRFDAKDEEYQIGDILCANCSKIPSSFDDPLLVVGIHSEHLLYVVKGKTKVNSERNIGEFENNIELRGFAQKVSFDLSPGTNSAILSKCDVKFKIEESTQEFRKYLSKKLTVKALNSNAHA